MSLSRPQLAHTLTHTGAAHLTRKGRVYYYRRRLPLPIGGEVGLSLRTVRYREAEHLAWCLDTKLAQALTKQMAPKDLTAILREYLDHMRALNRDAHRDAPSDRSICGLALDDDADPIDADLEFVLDMIGDRREAISRRNWAKVTNLAEMMRVHEIPDEQRTEFAEGVLAADIAALEELRDRLGGRLPVVPSPTYSITPSAPPPATPSGPRFSELIDGFVAAMQAKKKNPWPPSETNKARSVFSLFLNWCGDKPLRAYGRNAIYSFYKALAKLPNNHGKSPADRNRSMQEKIEAAAEGETPTLTAKTMEGYATKLMAFFEEFRDNDDVNWVNPAEGFTKFEEYGRASMERAMWSGPQLVQLLSSPVWTGGASEERPRTAGNNIYANERYWLPILALYHGARLEELARLVRSEIVEDGAVSYMLITDDAPPGKDGVKIERKGRVKSRAARRRVPIHSAVLALGFLEYVHHVAPGSADFIFPDLKPNPNKENQRSAKFSQWFTDYRRDMGIDDPCFVFHSFRHGVSTKLMSASGAAIGPIIALIGHAQAIAKALDAETIVMNYLRSETIPLSSLKATVELITFPEVTLRRPTVYSDGTPFPQR